MIDSATHAKLPRSDVNRIARKSPQRSLPSTRINESRDSRIIERRFRAVTAYFATFNTKSQHLVITDVRCRLKNKTDLLRWIPLPVGQRFGIAIRGNSRKVLIERLARAVQSNQHRTEFWQ